MTLAHLPMAAFLPFLIVLLGGALVHRVGKGTLAAREVAVILSMLLIATTIPGKAFSSYFLALISAPYYFASPENRWVENFYQYLPHWLMVSNEGEAVRGFYEGLSTGQSIPWTDWITPMLWWASFLGALFMVGASIITILRKQWVENERLVFPLARVPLEMVRTADRGALPLFLKKKLFWIGFGLIFSIIGWNIVGYFILAPKIPIGAAFSYPLNLGRYFPQILARINIYTLCFAFFTEVNVLFSIWFFYLFGVLQSGLINRLGLGAGSGVAGAEAVVDAQNFGGFVLFVLWGLWISRRYLKRVLLTALGKSGGEDDSHEFVSYRTAVIALAVGILYILFWLNAAGMSYWVALFLLFVLLINYLGVTRVVAETGLVFLDLPVNAHVFSVQILGSSTLSRPTLTAMVLGHGFARNYRGFGMSALAHIGKITTELKINSRKIFTLASLAIVISFITAMTYVIFMGYKGIGAYQFGQYEFTTGGVDFFNQVVHWMHNPTRISPTEITFAGVGIGITGALLLLRYRFVWWPLHPIGFVIGYADIIHISAVSIFLAWLFKFVILKIGGIDLYRKSRFFFLGMLTAHAIGTGLSFLVDVVWFPGQGHSLHNW